ncbi:hypothetical protein GTP90_13695 [Rugamonas sp. FT81W]|uniref:Uncharacterized protein n=1 Tax=Duganella vulcania TaxID=2692166 RepID=A0A845GP19_9BURK|nr:hypothetical protein [Duganella vulcania]
MCVSGVAYAGSTSPRDVQAFIKNADLCVHLAGEWDSDLPEQEQKDLKLSMDKYCGAAKKQLNKLSIKYKKNAAVQKTLSQYDDSVKLYGTNQ